MKNSAYVGLDVHKLTIAIAIAEAGASGEVRFFGEIANSPAAVASKVKKLAPPDTALTARNKVRQPSIARGTRPTRARIILTKPREPCVITTTRPATTGTILTTDPFMRI